jgi:hypothetical protein
MSEGLKILEPVLNLKRSGMVQDRQSDRRPLRPQVALGIKKLNLK